MLLLGQRAFSCPGTLFRAKETRVGCNRPSANICNLCTAVRAGCKVSFCRIQREVGTSASDSSHCGGNDPKRGCKNSLY